MYILLYPNINVFSSVQISLSDKSDSETPWTAARQASLSFAISQSLLKLTSGSLDLMDEGRGSKPEGMAVTIPSVSARRPGLPFLS